MNARNALLSAIALLLLPLTAQAQNAIVHLDTPGQTLYVRIFTSSTASVAHAMTEGTSGAVGRYVVTNATLSAPTDALDTAGDYPFKVFSGTPSTTANDTLLGQEVLHWSGSAALPDKADVTYWSGTATPTPDTAGYPKVTIKDGTGTGELDTASGTVLLTAGQEFTIDAASQTALAEENRDVLLAAALSDTGATTVGRAIYWLYNTFASDGVFDSASLANVAATTADTRDLEPVGHTWQMARTSSGMRSRNAVVLHPGDTIRAGWNCAIPPILPTGAVLAEMTTPTSSDDSAGVNVVQELGIDPTVAKVEISVDADAVAGDYWITTTVTNSLGGGPVNLYGKVTVVAAP